jgi:transposase InsO family protein
MSGNGRDWPRTSRRGDSYNNALAETIIGLFKTEVIHHRGPWKGMEDVEFAALCWVSWYNVERIMESLGYLSPAEYEAQYLRTQSSDLVEVGLN